MFCRFHIITNSIIKNNIETAQFIYGKKRFQKLTFAGKINSINDIYCSYHLNKTITEN